MSPIDVPADLAKELLEKDLANIAKRVSAGYKLTKAERALLNVHAAQNPDAGQTYAGSYVELADALGVSRRTIQEWRKRPHAPTPASDGRHDVMAWRVYMRQHGLAQHTEPTTLDEDQLKTRKLLAEVEERELKVAIKKEQYVPVDVVATEWTTRVGRAVSLLRNKFESELPPILSGLNAAAIQSECRKAIDEVLTVLHTGG
ncbi:hypothetical protein EBZ39_03210 [bacterium]|nr:hypothetical protein [bacterium]